MKYLSLLTIATTLIISTFVCSASTLKTRLDDQLELNSKRYGVVGQSVVILKNHQPVYNGRHGLANVELGVQIDENHIFPSYSVTKLFTSVLMMQLVEKGQVELSQSVNTYLTELPKTWASVTVEHLLSHTSGIPRYFDIAMRNNKFLPNKIAVFLSLENEPDHFPIGTANQYNNTNFLLLAAILEKITNKTYQQLVAEVIVEPLNLKNTGHASAKEPIYNLVSSYRGQEGIIKRNKNIDWPKYTFSHSALYSTPEELTKFMTALVNGQFVKKDTLKQLWQPMQLTDGSEGRYAFGFEYAVQDGYVMVGHDGGNQIKLRHYFNPADESDNYTVAYATNGNAYSVWTDVLTESLVSNIAPQRFVMAALKERFMTASLSGKEDEIDAIYPEIVRYFNSDKKAIEQFILYRAYALRYGSGGQSSLSAFEYLLKKFPDSKSGKRGLEHIKTLINK